MCRLEWANKICAIIWPAKNSLEIHESAKQGAIEPDRRRMGNGRRKIVCTEPERESENCIENDREEEEIRTRSPREASRAEAVLVSGRNLIVILNPYRVKMAEIRIYRRE